MSAQSPKVTISMDFEFAFKDKDLLISHENNLLKYIQNNNNDLISNYLLVIAFIDMFWDIERKVQDRDLWNIRDNLLMAMAKDVSWNDYEEFLFTYIRDVYAESFNEVEQNVWVAKTNEHLFVNGEEVAINFNTPNLDFYFNEYGKFIISDIDGKIKALFSSTRGEPAVEIVSWIEKAVESAKHMRNGISHAVIELFVKTTEDFETKKEKIEKLSKSIFPDLELEFRKGLPANFPNVISFEY